MAENNTIHDVSDTALWVAHYRALETKEKNPLFRDTLAEVLVGERGKKIAENMKSSSKYTQWAVIIRTYIIDNFIQNLVREGVDTIINLGAGLDTRPYRMDLPSHLKWIEVDYPHMIEHKEKLLAHEKPRVQLQRIKMDLANNEERKKLLLKLGSETQKAMILTEGVIPYLSEEHVADLADELNAIPSFKYWTTEYFSPLLYRYFQSSKQTQKMRNAPFRFFPKDWFDFFKQHGWVPKEINYLQEATEKAGRKVPLPWFINIFTLFTPKEKLIKYQRQAAYVLFTKEDH